MSLMGGVVQLAFMKSFVVLDDFEIYTDTIWFVVTLKLAQIQIGNLFCCNFIIREAFVSSEELGWEKELPALLCQ